MIPSPSEERAQMPTETPAVPATPESIRRVEKAWRDDDYCLHVQHVPAWLPSLDEEKKALASLSKAWPVLSEHANHIDGQFDLALTDVRMMFAAFRAEIAEYAARGTSQNAAKLKAKADYWMHVAQCGNCMDHQRCDTEGRLRYAMQTAR